MGKIDFAKITTPVLFRRDDRPRSSGDISTNAGFVS